MIWDLFRLAVRNCRNRQLRAWLTVLGILIGTAAVVALISIGQGLERMINDQVEGIMGYNTLIISTMGPGGAGLAGIQLDVEMLRAIPGVETAVAMRTETIYAEGPSGRGFLTLLGYDPAMESFVSQLDIPSLAGTLSEPGQVVLGARTAEALGAQVGDQVLIEGQPFVVVDMLARVEGGGGFVPGVPLNDALVVSTEDMRGVVPGPGLVQYAVVRAREGARIDAVRVAVEQTLASEPTAQVIGSEDITRQINTMLSGVQAFLASIAGIAILVGGIGVMNTMYTAVLERTREIGVMKAVGAKRRYVLWLFLFESGLMGLAGGILGLVFGLGGAWAAALIAGRLFQVGVTFSPSFGAGLIFGALLFAAGMGALSGILPAMRASRLNPVEALRYE
jgi:putative ABC transport system permease protein